MKDQPSFASDNSSDSMYTDDDVTKDRSGLSSGKGKPINNQELDLLRNDYSRKEKEMQYMIHSLEQEVIKLQLQNRQLAVTTPGGS